MIPDYCAAFSISKASPRYIATIFMALSSRNMERLADEIDGVVSKTVIYDGVTMGSMAVNIRDIFRII